MPATTVVADLDLAACQVQGPSGPKQRDESAAEQVDLYGAGTHNWVYWQRELHAAWPLIAGGLGIGP
jgi:hypothetical protein